MPDIVKELSETVHLGLRTYGNFKLLYKSVALF